VSFVELVAAGLLEFYSLPNTAALQKCDMVQDFQLFLHFSVEFPLQAS